MLSAVFMFRSFFLNQHKSFENDASDNKDVSIFYVYLIKTQTNSLCMEYGAYAKPTPTSFPAPAQHCHRELYF